MVEKEISFTVLGHSFPIKYPRVGEFYRIEALKQRLSGGFYNVMIASSSISAQAALDMIDIEATLVVLCPKFVEELKVKNFSELDIRDYKEIRDEFYKVVAPFLKEINDLLIGVAKDDVNKD